MLSFLVIFIIGAALGSYVQTMTGFALGIVVTGVVALSGAVPIADTADALSIIGIINAAVVLPSMASHISWSSLTKMMFALTPGMMVGVVLLSELSAHHSTTLRLLAGVIVLLGGASLFIRPRPSKKAGGVLGMSFFGISAGVMSGLFSLPGPPVVYYYYRQLLPLETVRATLITIFAVLSILRLVFVQVHSGVGTDSIKMAFFSIPVVVIGSWLGVRFPPKVSDLTARRIAFAILTAMGVLTIIMALKELTIMSVPRI